MGSLKNVNLVQPFGRLNLIYKYTNKYLYKQMSEELYCINYTFPSVGDSKLLTPAVVNKQTRRKVNKH